MKLDKLAVELLAAHDWPGNVRQLQNVIERLVVLNTSGLILEQEVLPCLGGPTPGMISGGAVGSVALDASVADAEKTAIRQALKASNGNRTHAAKALGISRRSLHNKLREYSIV